MDGAKRNGAYMKRAQETDKIRRRAVARQAMREASEAALQTVLLINSRVALRVEDEAVKEPESKPYVEVATQ